MSTLNENEMGFVNTQYVYLRYLNSTTDFDLSIHEEETIVDFGTTNYTYAGFARSIYYRITGNRLIPTRDESQPRSSAGSKIVKDLTVYPNPTNSDLVNININADNFQSQDQRKVTVEVYNMSGVRVAISYHIYDENLQVLLPSKGLFLIRIIANSKVLGTSKILIL
ncbi:MAG: hypothetical protein ACJATI_003390 [Halioglobus sp.]|jgi:hypothetical protein